MAEMDILNFDTFKNSLDSNDFESRTARSSSPICDAIMNGNSKWNSQILDDNSNDMYVKDSDNSFGEYYVKDRANSLSDYQRPRRPITNKSVYGSLPKESRLNNMRSPNFAEIDASLSWRSNLNRNPSPMRSTTYNKERNDYFYSYVGDIDQQKMSGERDLLNDIPDRNHNEGKRWFEPSMTRNGGHKESIGFNTAISYLSKASEFNNRCKIAANFNSNEVTLNGSFGVYFGNTIWSDLGKSIVGDTTDRFRQMAILFRDKMKKIGPSYTWSGQLPKRNRNKNPIYSCKVFLGGIPYDLTDSDLHLDFAKFGPIQIQWPGYSVKSAIDGAAANKAGYVYVIFESYDNVTALLNACTVSYKDLDSGCRWYFNMNSRRTKMKEVQVIPFDIGDRFYMKGSFSGQMEHSKTVFVGALHGMLSADGLAKVMDDLFGGVIFAGLDTDKHKYPLGSGRVSFDNNESYMKAVSAAFVEIKSSRFRKTIQIDPYIENESICDICKIPQQSPIFCRDLACFQYYCRNCWDVKHSDSDYSNHRPIIKNKSA